MEYWNIQLWNIQSHICNELLKHGCLKCCLKEGCSEAAKFNDQINIDGGMDGNHFICHGIAVFERLAMCQKLLRTFRNYCMRKVMKITMEFRLHVR